jgi:hypothetical protein
VSVRCALALTLVVIVACGGGEDEARRAAEREDVTRLEALLARDPATAPLRAADEAVDDDLPVRAAHLLEDRGLPAAREAVSAAEALEVRSAEGRRLARALAAAYRARVGALERTERALARGVADDLVLADAFRAQREAEEQILAVHRDVEALRRGPTASADR